MIRIFSRSLCVFLLTVLALAMLAACGPSSSGASTNTSTGSTSFTYTDSTKTQVTLTKQPQRFVCITAICEDILAELGMQPVAVSDNLSAEPEFFGAKAKGFAAIGGTFFQPSLEDIAKAKPDLVIGLAGVHDKLRSSLKPIAPLYIMDLSSYKDSIHYLEDIGRLTGRTEQAQAAENRFMKKLQTYEAKSPKTKSAGLLSGSDVNFAMDTDAALYGGLLAKVTRWPWPAPQQLQSGQEQDNTVPYSLEKVLAVNPDVLFVLSDGKTPESKLLATNPLWSKLKAVQQHQVYEVRPDVWEYGRGTRSLGIALDEAMHLLYPSAFPAANS